MLQRYCAVFLLVLPLGSLGCSGCVNPPGTTDGGGPVGVSDGGAMLVGEGPVVQINDPADGAFFAPGMTVTFDCSATDAEDGALMGTAIAWTSSLDGMLGAGNTVQTALATLGDHLISCAAGDSDGNLTTDQITVHVVDNVPPAVNITSPDDGTFFLVDSTVEFTGDADDAEDGALTGLALVWTIDGAALGSGALVQTAVAAGDHDIVLTATDSEGATGSASVTIHVVTNLPPVCIITAPDEGAAIVVGASTVFSADCVDDGAAIANASIGWAASVDGALGTGATIQNALATLGAQTIAVCAEDAIDPAVVGCDEITVSVVEPLPQMTPPVVTITAPSDGDIIAAGTASLALTGTATDAEDGTLTPTWSSDTLGTIGTGASQTVLNPPPGPLVLTLSATDTDGLSAQDQISLTVESAAGPLAEDVAIANNGAAEGTLVDDVNGVWWVAFDGELRGVDPAGVAADILLSDATNFPQDKITAIGVLPDGRIVVGTDLEPGLCDPDLLTCEIIDWDAIFFPGMGQNGQDIKVSDIVVLADGRSVIGTENCLLISDWAGPTHILVCQADGLAGDEVNTVAINPATGEILVGTKTGLSIVSAPANATTPGDLTITNLNMGDGLPDNDINGVTAGPSGDVWIGTDGGLTRYAGGVLTTYTTADGLPANQVSDVAVDVVPLAGVDHEVVWCATDAGLARVDIAVPSFTTLTTADGLPDNNVRTVVVGPDHLKLIGTDSGAMVYRGW